MSILELLLDELLDELELSCCVLLELELELLDELPREHPVNTNAKPNTIDKVKIIFFFYYFLLESIL